MLAQFEFENIRNTLNLLFIIYTKYTTQYTSTMATSRLEKIGNIYTRIQGLIKSGAMKYDDRPLFFEIYQAFPPLKEPKYCEPVDPSIKIRPIFYAEDVDRASRDESNTFYNLNEARGKRLEPIPYQKQEFTSSPPKDKQKLFDLKDLTDLKE